MTSIFGRKAKQSEWKDWYAEREAALFCAELPECEWMRSLRTSTGTRELKRRVASIEDHVESCERCKARDRYAAEHFRPMPPIPETWFDRALSVAARLPRWTWPALFGALVLGGITSVRVLAALPLLFRKPKVFGQALLAPLAAAGAGAIGGFAYSLTRPFLKRLGRPGDYLTGIVCVIAYVGAIVLVAPVAFGDRLIHGRDDIAIFLIVSVFFGLVIGHTWFREKA